MKKRLYKIPLENYFEIRKENEIYAGFSNETNSWIDPFDIKGRLYRKQIDRSIENPKNVFFECLLEENNISKSGSSINEIIWPSIGEDIYSKKDWDELATNHINRMTTYEKPIINILTKNMKDYILSEEGSIIELFCSHGMLINKMQEILPKFNFTGVDNSSKMVEIAKRNNPKANIIEDDVMNISLHDFDAVIIRGLSRYVVSQKFAELIIKKACSFLKNKGLVFISSFKPPVLNSNDYEKYFTILKCVDHYEKKYIPCYVLQKK